LLSESRRRFDLGNLNSIRDSGYAPEHVEAMWLMLQAEEPEDYVVAMGAKYTVGEFLQPASKHIGKHGCPGVVEIDPSLLRPSDVPSMRETTAKPKRSFAGNRTQF